RSGSPATMALETKVVETRRAEDGGMATARRTGDLDPRPQPAVARPPRLAPAAAAARRPLRPRPAHRGQLAARRRLGRRLPSVLLLPRQPGAKSRDGGRPAVAPGRPRPGARRAARVRPGRHADQTRGAEGRGGRYPPQPDAGPGRPEVPLRPCLGDPRLA